MRMANTPLAARSRARSPRRATNVTIRPDYIAEARELGINLSEVLEQGLERAIAEARAERWQEENREAIESSNRWVEENGLPLAGMRLF